MNFVETILMTLVNNGANPSLVEVCGKNKIPTTGSQLLECIERVQNLLRSSGVRPGDRIVLLAPNSSMWVACDLAILAYGAICVPLYSRQLPEELAFMAKDCQPKLIIISDETLKISFQAQSPISCEIVTFEEIRKTDRTSLTVHKIRPNDVVTIVYTSGTSGNPKGAMLTCGNIDYMLSQTIERLESATKVFGQCDRVFHFLPVCFAGSRMMLWSQLQHGHYLMLSTDLSNLVEEMATVEPHYYLTVPAVLERIRNGVTQKIKEKGVIALLLYQKGQHIFFQKTKGRKSIFENLILKIVRPIVFSKIRQKIGKSLKFIICGSAPLSEETQRWFEMIGIPVLQVYGLTETTAIITMDRPNSVKPGWVGEVIEGCEAKLTEEGELICRGPNIFRGYWNRTKASEEMIQNGWLYTGDQAEIDEQGRWRISGRINNILVPASGHNVAPEPLEQLLKEECPQIDHAVVIGHGRPFLTALITGNIENSDIAQTLERTNRFLPHYRKIRAFYRSNEPLSVENGLLTANQKLRRKAIEAYFKDAIEELYRKEAAA